MAGVGLGEGVAETLLGGVDAVVPGATPAPGVVGAEAVGAGPTSDQTSEAPLCPVSATATIAATANPQSTG